MGIFQFAEIVLKYSFVNREVEQTVSVFPCIPTTFFTKSHGFAIKKNGWLGKPEMPNPGYT
jgi:hypothetical protein